MIINEYINIAIMDNEKSIQDWELSSLARELYWWIDFFNIAFFKDQPIPVPVISFERTKISSFGHYVIGRNAFGIKENINLNRAHLNRPFWEILATLLHEACHSWEHCYIKQGNKTKTWYHSKVFREKMLSFGILCNEKGHHKEIGNPFVFHLKKHGVYFGSNTVVDGLIKISPRPKPKGKSKLSKWSCGCTNVRVAVKGFRAKCIKCDSTFELVS
jgi:hypothetical protein